MANIRIQKILADAGFCSRRKAEALISAGKVQRNGRPVKLGDSSAVSVSIKDGRITEYKHKLTSFHPTGNYVYIDSYIDALRMSNLIYIAKPMDA